MSRPALLAVVDLGDGDYTATVLGWGEHGLFERASASRASVGGDGRRRAIAAACTAAGVDFSDCVEVEYRCPGCGHQGPHDDNLADGLEELAFCCDRCGEQFDAVEQSVDRFRA